jgi:hypothetical protein
LAKQPPLHPLPREQTEAGGGQPRGASVWWPGGVLPGPTAAGGRGNRRRRARAFHPRAHLRLERREAADRRRTEGGGGANGGGAVELGERLCDSSKAVWCGEGVVVAALNRRRRSVGGGGDISGEVTGELGLLLEVRPDSCGDR